MPISIPVVLDTESLESQLAELKRKAQETGKAIGDGIGSGAKKAEKSADDAAKGLEDLGDAAGLPVDKLKKLSSGFAALANPTTAAVAAIGAFAVGIGLAVTGIVAAVSASEELADALKPLSKQEGFGISKAQLASIQSANDAMSALGAILKQVVLRLGAEFAPAVEKGATLLVKFGLMALDAFNTFADGHDILRELAIFLTDMFISSILGVFNGLANLVGMLGKLARAVGEEELAGKLEAVNEQWDAFTRGLATRAVDYATDGIKRIDAATGNYDERAKKLIGSVKLLDGATKKLTDTYAASIKAIDEDNALTAKASDLIDSLTSSARKSAVDRLSGEAAIKAALEDQLAALEAVYQQAIQTAYTDQQRADATAAYEQARTEAVLAAEQKIQEAQQKTADDATKNAQDIADAAQSATVGAISGLQGGLESIAALIGGPVAGAIAGLVLNLEDTVTSLIEQLKSLPGIVKSIPKLVVALVEAIVDVIPELVKAVPALITGIIDAIPKLVTALIVGLIEAIPSLITTAVELLVMLLVAQSGYLAVKLTVEIIKALVESIPVVIAEMVADLREWWDKFASGELTYAMIDAAKAFAAALWESVKSYYDMLVAATQKEMEKWVDMWKEILTLGKAKTSLDGSGKKAGDVWKEVLTLGLADTKTYGDAPSMQRAGPQGDSVRTSPGDYFLVGRNPQALLEQALNGVFGNSPAPVAASGGGSVNLAWQHRAFDGFFVNHASLGGETTEFFRQMRARDARGM